METKPLLYGLIGFFIGGLLVAIAANTFDKKEVLGDTSMVSSLQHKTGDDYDRAFIADMIDHHQSAIDMAKLSEKNAKHEEIRQLSLEIITSQQKEIDKMRQWQTWWGYSQTDTQHSRAH